MWPILCWYYQDFRSGVFVKNVRCVKLYIVLQEDSLFLSLSSYFSKAYRLQGLGYTFFILEFTFSSNFIRPFPLLEVLIIILILLSVSHLSYSLEFCGSAYEKFISQWTIVTWPSINCNLLSKLNKAVLQETERNIVAFVSTYENAEFLDT